MSYEQLTESVDRLATVNADLKSTVVVVRTEAESSRDAAQAFAIDALGAASEVAGELLAADTVAAAAAEVKVAALRGPVASNLNTLAKLADAIGGDPNFHQTVDNFLQEGTGAVLRSRLDKSKDVLNVKDYGVTGVGDETTLLQAIASYAATAKKRLIIDVPMTVREISIDGHVDIETQGAGTIKFTGTGRGGIIAKNNWKLITQFTAVGSALFPASVGLENNYLDVVDASTLTAYDTIYIKDSVPNAYTSTSSCVAEIATIVAKSGNRLYLDCRLRRPMSSGSVYLLPKTKCSIIGNFYGDREGVRASVVYMEGYVAPYAKIALAGNSSRGLMLMSCMQGEYRVQANDLDNKSADNRLGYAVVAYGACKAGVVNVQASNVRHAYTDGVYSSSNLESGHVVDFHVNGVCYSPTAAGFDTHPDSDGTVFGDIAVWSSHNDDQQPSKSLNFAVQLRGSNHTIMSLKTDLDKGIVFVPTRAVNSIDKIFNVDHRDNLRGAVSGTNRFQSVMFLAGEVATNPITQTGSHLAKFYSSDLGLIQYETGGIVDEYYNCTMDWSKTTAGWPASPAIGGNHKYYNCVISNPTNMDLNGNDEYYLNGTTINPGTGRSFNLRDGAKLTAINSGINALGFSVPNSSFAYSTLSTGSATFKYNNVWINDDRVEFTPVAFNNLTTGTAAISVKNLSAKAEVKGLATRGNADVTLTMGISQINQRFTAALTADRLVSLSLVNAKAGDSFNIARSATGAFNLQIGGLKALAVGQWCVVSFDGTAWQLMASGSL